MAVCGEKEWYFFSPRDRKYPNGSRPNRAAGCGYWKATGADKPIGQPKPLAIKKALVFYAGKAPKGDKTNWIMHEYRLADVDRSARKFNPKHRTNNLRLDDWVLCRIYNKKGSFEKQKGGNKKLDILAPSPQQAISHSHITYNMGATSDSIQPPQLHDSTTSCSEREVGSEHVITPSEKEVESQNKLTEFDFDKTLGFPSFNYIMDASTNLDNPFSSQFQGGNQMSPLQDIFMFLQKPL